MAVARFPTIPRRAAAGSRPATGCRFACLSSARKLRRRVALAEASLATLIRPTTKGSRGASTEGQRRLHLACRAAYSDALTLGEGDRARAYEAAEPDSSVTTWEIVRFVLPALGVWITKPLLSLVDTAVVGQASALELAALGPGVLLCDHSAYVFNFLAIATANLLALAFASRSQQQTEAVMNESLSAALLVGVLSGAAYFVLAPQCVAAMAGSGGAELIAPASQYVQIRALGLVAFMATSVLQCFFLAARSPVTPMLAGLAAGAVNLAGDHLLCNILGLGIKGAAMAATGAQLVACALLVSAIRKRQPENDGEAPSGWKLNLRASMPSLTSVARLAKFAGPVGLVLLTKVAMYFILSAPIAAMGAVASGAHHLCFTLFMFFVVFSDAVSMACQAFLPSRIGRPLEAPQALGRRLISTAAVIGAANSLIAAAILTFGSGLFVNDPAVAATVAKLVPVVAATLFVQTCSMATEGIMLAGRKYYYLVSTYLFNCGMVGVAYQAATAAGLGQLMAVWCGIFTFHAMRLIINLAVLATPFSVLRAKTPLAALQRSA